MVMLISVIIFFVNWEMVSLLNDYIDGNTQYKSKNSLHCCTRPNAEYLYRFLAGIWQLLISSIDISTIQMIWEQGCSMIVMLTDIVEEGKVMEMDFLLVLFCFVKGQMLSLLAWSRELYRVWLLWDILWIR